VDGHAAAPPPWEDPPADPPHGSALGTGQRAVSGPSEPRGLYEAPGAPAGPLPRAAGRKGILPLATPVRTQLGYSCAFDSIG